MTALGVTDTVNVDNVVSVTGSVYIVNPHSASFNLSASITVPVSVNQGTGSVSTPWFITASVPLDVIATPAPSPGATVTVFTASLFNTVLSAPNPNRQKVLFTNDDWSSGSLYLKFGPGASTGSYSVKVRPGILYELPCTYTGEIDGVWDDTIGTLFVTEFSF